MPLYAFTAVLTVVYNVCATWKDKSWTLTSTFSGKTQLASLSSLLAPFLAVCERLCTDSTWFLLFSSSLITLNSGFYPHREHTRACPAWCGCVSLCSCCGWGPEAAQRRPTHQTWLNTQPQTSMRNCILGRWCLSISSIKVGCSPCRTSKQHYLLHICVVHLLKYCT